MVLKSIIIFIIFLQENKKINFMFNPLNKNIFVNDVNQIKKVNKNKKRLIISSSIVVYSFDISNKKNK